MSTVDSICSTCGHYLALVKTCEYTPYPHANSGSAMGKRLSDDAGLAEMKRMEYLMSKAPCLARLNDLAAYAAKDDDDIQPTA